MKNYDLSIDMGMARIRVYIQIDEYKGFFEINISGNVKGKKLLDEAIDTDYLEQYDIKRSNCKLKIFEEEQYFSCILKNKKGDTLEVENNLDFLSDMIVGCKILEFKEEE